jgi:hypothetical protein
MLKINEIVKRISQNTHRRSILDDGLKVAGY